MFSHTDDTQFDEPEPDEDIDPQTLATEFLVRALQIGHAKGDADEWLNTGTIKNQMRRMDPSFNEKPLGFRSFTDFLSSHSDLVELEEDGPQRLIRLRPEAKAAAGAESSWTCRGGKATWHPGLNRSMLHSWNMEIQDIRAHRRTQPGIDWDQRYAEMDKLWSGQPNGALVSEVNGLRPGRVLDVGCGEGADALWLAEQGWDVTALDVSKVALDRAAREADRAGTEGGVAALRPGRGGAPGGLLRPGVGAVPRPARHRGQGCRACAARRRRTRRRAAHRAPPPAHRCGSPGARL